MNKKKNLENKINQTGKEDSLLPEVYNYLNKFDFPLAQLLQRKFKIGFSRAERILKQLEARKKLSKSLEAR